MRPTEQKEETRSGMDRIFYGFIAIALSAFIVFSGAYAFKFGFPARFALSRDPEDWEHFGAYLGGVLGPIYALLAFIGVLITILLQRRQIDDLRSQSTQQALQQLLATTTTKIDEILRGPPVVKRPKTFGFLDTAWETVSVGRLLKVAARSVQRLAKRDPRLLEVPEWIPTIKKYVGPDARDLAFELDQVVACLERYREAGGTEALELFYLARYEKVVNHLYVIDIKLSERVASGFKLQNEPRTPG